MTKAAIIVLAGNESHADLGSLVNALQAATEFQDEGDQVELVIDGAGTRWVPELESGDHDASPLYEALEENVSVCEFCAGAFDVEEEIEEGDGETVAEYEGHPSVRSLVADGYEVLTY